MSIRARAAILIEPNNSALGQPADRTTPSKSLRARQSFQ
jgi:hypothetical protein